MVGATLELHVAFESPSVQLLKGKEHQFNFLFTVEEATGVSIPDEQIQDKSLSTLGQLVAFVDERR